MATNNRICVATANRAAAQKMGACSGPSAVTEEFKNVSLAYQREETNGFEIIFSTVIQACKVPDVRASGSRKQNPGSAIWLNAAVEKYVNLTGHGRLQARLAPGQRAEIKRVLLDEFVDAGVLRHISDGTVSTLLTASAIFLLEAWNAPQRCSWHDSFWSFCCHSAR